MSRTSPHIIETKAKDHVRKRINEFFLNGDALFRDLSERDYGIDAVVELFNNGDPTGKFALIQIKGSENEIVPLRKSAVVACQISSSNARYAFQNRIPVILIYVTLSKLAGFYYIDLQTIIKNSNIENNVNHQKTITIHIPIENNAQEDLKVFFQVINDFYDAEYSLR